MRTRAVVTYTVVLCALAGCGSSGKFANKPRPAAPVNLTVYVNNARVSVSPATAGAGEVVFVITNQADKAESITIHPAGDSTRSLASTGPINPQSTAQVTVDFAQPGDYTVATGKSTGTDADVASPNPIQPAQIRIGKARASSSNQLLQP
ncbi:MAG TPA: hypothetical protein VGI87_01970 [Solirubrobacteraceae bacterium]|jgi:hypothetical protein